MPLILIIIIAVFALRSTATNNSHMPMTEAEQADALIQKVAKEQGLKPEQLGDDNQVAYGTLQFRYVPENHMIETAILISQNGLWNKINDEATKKYLIAKQALMNPAIGGLFDSGGGSWRFEESTGSTYLYRDYALDTSAKAISQGIDAMTAVAPEWVSTWSTVVANIAHGHEPAPANPVTLKDNPYKDRL